MMGGRNKADGGSIRCTTPMNLSSTRLSTVPTAITRSTYRCISFVNALGRAPTVVGNRKSSLVASSQGVATALASPFWNEADVPPACSHC